MSNMNFTEWVEIIRKVYKHNEDVMNVVDILASARMEEYTKNMAPLSDANCNALWRIAAAQTGALYTHDKVDAIKLMRKVLVDAGTTHEVHSIKAIKKYLEDVQPLYWWRV